MQPNHHPTLLGRLVHTHGLTAQLLLNDCGSLMTHFLLGPGFVLFFGLQTRRMSLGFPKTFSYYFHLVPSVSFLFEAMACGGNFFSSSNVETACLFFSKSLCHYNKGLGRRLDTLLLKSPFYIKFLFSILS